MSAARLLQSVANLHNALLCLVIFTFVYISFIPSKQTPLSKTAEFMPANGSGSNDMQYCVPKESVSCENVNYNVDLTPFNSLLANYEQLKFDFIQMREEAVQQAQEKAKNAQASFENLQKQELLLQNLLETLQQRQHIVASRIERLQHRIATPRNITRIDERVVEISGSCPVFQLQNTLEYKHLTGQLEQTTQALATLTSQYQLLQSRSVASQQWLQRLTSALPMLSDRIASAQAAVSISLPSFDTLDARIAAMVQNEIHDQWKTTKASPETFAELYRLSTETFETITERWQQDIDNLLHGNLNNIDMHHNNNNHQHSKKERSSKISGTVGHFNHHNNEFDVHNNDDNNINSNENKTPAIDYALASAGATVVIAETSPTYLPSLSDSGAISGFVSHAISKSLLGAGPEDALSPLLTRGSCWPMAGSVGNLTIQLPQTILVNAVTLEHFTGSEDMTSAPRTFHVFARTNNDWEKVISWEAFDASQGKMTFPIEVEDQRIARQIRLEIVENYGHPQFTCIYRFRVHGKPV